MRAIYAVLICLIVCAIFTHTAVAAFGPLVQQDDNLELNGRAASPNSRKVSRKRMPSLIMLGDPIEDPTPHNR